MFFIKMTIAIFIALAIFNPIKLYTSTFKTYFLTIRMDVKQYTRKETEQRTDIFLFILWLLFKKRYFFLG